MHIRKKHAAATALFGLALILGAAAPAVASPDVTDAPMVVTPLVNAYENDTAADSATPTYDYWNSTTGAKGAIKKYGDILYVQDTKTDGYSAYVLWENRLSDTNGAWHLYREGRCEYYGGSGHWGACNKNWYETGNTNALGGYQSQVRIKTCRNVPNLTDNCTSWGTWKNNDS